MAWTAVSTTITGAAALRQAWYGAALFLTSAGGMVLEIAAGRLLAPYVGMSLYTWTAVIAVVLAGFSLGNWIGGWLATGESGAKRASRRLAFALALAALFALASLVLLRLLSPLILGVGLSPVIAIVTLTSALFLLPSLFVGIVAPVLTKLAVDEKPDRRGRILGRMFALGTGGGIAGTLAAGYVFLSWIGMLGTVISVAAVYAALALAFAVAGRPIMRTATTVGAGVVVTALGLSAVGVSVRAFESPCVVESRHYCIRVIDFSAKSGRPSRMLMLDRLVHGISDRDDPGLLHSSYIELLDKLARLRFGGQDAISAFHIGGGGYTLPRAWMHRYPNGEQLVAEIDPEVTRAAREYMWFAPRPNVRIVHRDARAVLQGLPPKPRFDVVFGDAFHDISIPPHLASREFAVEVAKRLRPGGFYAVNVADNGRKPLFLLSFVRTLQTVFPSIEAWAEPAQLASGGLVAFLVVAADRPTETGRLASGGPTGREWRRWPGDDLAIRIAGSNAPLLSDDYAPVERLMAHNLGSELYRP